MTNIRTADEEDLVIDPVKDIIEYLVRCAKISFINPRVQEIEVKTLKTLDEVNFAFNLYKQSPLNFLMQYGKYMTSSHIDYFNKSLNTHDCVDSKFKECLEHLKEYHSINSKNKRVKNRRYKALQKFIKETDYFSEKQMMQRNPLLYEQLVGQYLTDEEVQQRDSVDGENLTLLNLILETVDRSHLREKKDEQLREENGYEAESKLMQTNTSVPIKQWGEFESSEVQTNNAPSLRIQVTISAPERRLLREEFLQEMYSSFLEGQDIDIDYETIDNNEQYDDIQQLSQDAEDRYFDSESNDVENLEEHMKLVEEYGKQSEEGEDLKEDPLDEFMRHLNKKKL